jgi:hypothetical protein
MTARRTGTLALVAGVACFLIGGLSIVLRAFGAEVLGTQQTTTLAVFGLMLVAAGAAMQRRDGR